MAAADLVLLRWINAHHHGALDFILLPVSALGEYGAVWMLLIALALVYGDRRQRQHALVVAVTLLLVDKVLVHHLGEAYYRQRPYLTFPDLRQIGVRWETSSFPSGHAHSVWIGAVMYAVAYPRYRWFLLGFAVLTCYSRPYLGMHYPSDVLAGAGIGMAAGSLAAVGLARWWRCQGPAAETGVTTTPEPKDSP